MAHCWEERGCDEEMQSRCPHNRPEEPCPTECYYAKCDRPTNKVCEDFGLLLRVDLDREKAVKEVCRFCEFFCKNGPVLP